MQAHRIPQHVTGYESKLLGNFTARQFVYLAIGAIVVFILLNTLPLSFVTIILISTVGLFFVVFSLANVQGRSMDEWLAQFIQALHSTPQFVWDKHETVPTFLKPSSKKKVPEKEEVETQSQEKVSDFVKFWKSKKESGLSSEEHERLERLEQTHQELFGSPKETEEIQS